MALCQETQRSKLKRHFWAIFVCVVLIYFVQIGCQNEHVKKTCRKLIVGKIPDKENCKKYYQCTSGRPVHKECSSKKVFDKNKLNCLSAELVICGNGKVSNTTESQSTTPKKSPNTTSKKSTTKKSTTKKSTTKKSTTPPKTTTQETPIPTISEACVANKTNMKDVFSLWYEHKGSWYSLSVNNYKDDVTAEAVCGSICGTLVIIDNIEEEKFVLNLILGTGIRCFLIGGNDKETEGRFVISGTGQPVPYLRWARGQPDGGTFYNCLSYSSDADGMLDMSCSFKLNDPCLYVCESKHTF